MVEIAWKKFVKGCVLHLQFKKLLYRLYDILYITISYYWFNRKWAIEFEITTINTHTIELLWKSSHSWNFLSFVNYLSIVHKFSYTIHNQIIDFQGSYANRKLAFTGEIRKWTIAVRYEKPFCFCSSIWN